MFLFGVIGNLDDGFFGGSVGHLGGKSAVADEFIEFALVIVFASDFLLDMGGADRLVGFLGASGFGLEIANFEIIGAVFFLDELGSHGDGLLGEIETVGTVIGDETSLIESLGGIHGGLGGETEAGVGFNLHRSGGEGWRRVADARSLGGIGDGEFSAGDFF